MQKRNAILIFLILFSSVGACFAQDKIIDQVVAVVGSKPILLSDVENEYYRYRMQGYESGEDLKCTLFEEMLYMKLLLNQAELDSIEVTAKEVDAALENKLKYFISQIGSQEKLEAYFKMSYLEMKADFRDEVREALMTQKMQAKITDGVKITPAEVRSFFNTIPKDSLPQLNMEFEMEQIVKYPPVSEKEKLATKERLNEFRERILKGDKFATLAVLYSEDIATAKRGGELGFVGRAELDPNFAAVAFNLKEGEISRIVETEFGFHIIQMIERKGELINVRHILISPKVQPSHIANAKISLDSIVSMLKTDTISFEKAAGLFSEDISSRNNSGLVVNPATGNSKFESSQIDAITYTVIKDMNVGEYSKPFESKDLKTKPLCKIIKLKSRSKPHKANLTDDYQLIQDMALAVKKQEEVNRWIEKKLVTTYVRIDDSYRNCPFKIQAWIKKI